MTPKRLTKLYVDFETYYDSKTYTLSDMSETEYIRDPRFKVLGCGYLTEEGEYGWVRNENMDEFKKLDWRNIEMIAHHVKFDGAIFAWRYGIVPARYFDTKSLARAVIGQNLSNFSLKTVSQYLGLPPKGELHSDGLTELNAEQELQMMKYNERDLLNCRGIDELLRPAFPFTQMDALNWTIRAFTMPKLVLDTTLLSLTASQERQQKNEIFKKIGIPKEEFSSNKKFAALLSARGIEVPTKLSSKTGRTIPAFSLNDTAFVALKAVCPELYQARIEAKSTLVETRSEKLARVGRSGPFPFDVQFSGAIGTHRYSGGSGGGGNPQNFPTEGPIRESIQAPSGYDLIVGDFAAIEAREVSWLAKEPILCDKFSKNDDVYSAFASEVYGFKVNKKDNPLERKFGKTCILGLGYGMGADKFAYKIKQELGTDIGEEEANRVVRLYRDTYPNIPALWAQASGVIHEMKEGYSNYVPFAPFIKIEKNALVLPSGLIIQYPNLRWAKYWHPQWEKEVEGWLYDVYEKKYETTPQALYGGKLIENICQALAGEICKTAIHRAEMCGLEVVGQVHDEILVVAPSNESNLHADILKSCMEQPIEWWSVLRLGAEVKKGKSWAEAKR